MKLKTETERITPNEYQRLAMRTNDHKSTDRLLDTVANNPTIDVGGLINGCQGLTGESGEFVDIIKKWIFHNHELDEEHLKKEAGDICWYLALICQSMGWQLEEIMEMNILKLQARYPKGFDTEHSLHRQEGDI